jgi:hypothetical protein
MSTGKQACCCTVGQEILRILWNSKSSLLCSEVSCPEPAESNFAVYVQLRLILSRCFIFVVTICFSLAGHLQAYKDSAAHCPVHYLKYILILLSQIDSKVL